MNAIEHSGASLRRTVAMVCGLLEEPGRSLAGTALAEVELRFELVSCLLGSQVRAESANAAAERLRSAGLLLDERWASNDSAFERDVRDVLAGRGRECNSTSYRFPAMRARQLADLRTQLHVQPLRSYVNSAIDV